MYRIRSASGNEVTYNSLEEFSAAVRRGEVHPEDEIFHTRANRWLDVKSHPHYRSATTWQHHEPAAAAPAAAPSRPSPPGGTATSSARVFERPVVRTAPQTTVRPQLQAAPTPAPAPAPAPVAEVEPRPRKSKELEFIDVGNVPGTKPAAVTQEVPKVESKPAPPVAKPVAAAPAPAPAPPPAPAPAPKAAPAPPQAQAAPAAPPAPAATPATEVEFLVMDGGIESPVRTSAGYKTVPEDLGLLFDAPLPQDPSNAAAPTRGTAVAGAPPKPVVPASGSRAADRTSGAAGDAPNALAGEGSIDSDEMEIPPSTLLEAPPAEPEAHPAPTRKPASGSNTMLFGGGAAIVVVAAGLLAWRPWKSGTPAEPGLTPAVAAAQPATAPSPAPSSTQLVGAPAPTPIRTQSSATVPATKAGKATDSALAPKSDSAGDDEVIAVSKPSFKTDLAVPAPTDFAVNTATGSTATASPSELVRRLTAAERQAQQELNGRLAAAGFRNLLSSERLSNTSGVGTSRTAWGAGADAIRQYRGKIARLESAYEDSVLSAQRAKRWSGEDMRAWASRPSLAEPTETSQLADLMFSQVNEGLEILAALSGEYTVKGQAISFKNAASATRYTSIRGWVEQRMSAWAGIPESARPYSVTAILHALGDGFPAVQ